MSDDPQPVNLPKTGTSAVQPSLQSMFAGDPRVSLPEPGKRRFGSNGFKIDGKIFAMERQGALVVKLKAHRVRDLASEGVGTPLQMCNRTMKEWLVLEDPATWPSLALEARDLLARGSDDEDRP